MWHICKIQHAVSSTTPAPSPTTTPTTISTTTPQPTTTTKYEGRCINSDWIEFGISCYLLVKGESGLTWSDASSACASRRTTANLLWLNSADELAWFTDYSGRSWDIKKDYGQCQDCWRTVEGAWIGLYRDTDGTFKWKHNSKAVNTDL
jgi:hypothetical protein